VLISRRGGLGALPNTFGAATSLPNTFGAPTSRPNTFLSSGVSKASGGSLASKVLAWQKAGLFPASGASTSGGGSSAPSGNSLAHILAWRKSGIFPTSGVTVSATPPATVVTTSSPSSGGGGGGGDVSTLPAGSTLPDGTPIATAPTTLLGKLAALSMPMKLGLAVGAAGLIYLGVKHFGGGARGHAPKSDPQPLA
jgi:hypothetical protein